MKKDRKAKVRRIEEALKTVHRGRGLAQLSDSFSTVVMREIRGIGRIETERAKNGVFSHRNSAPCYTANLNGGPALDARTVWKFAACSALLTILVCGYLAGSDPSGVTCEMAEFAAGDSSALILAHSLALI